MSTLFTFSFGDEKCLIAVSLKLFAFVALDKCKQAQNSKEVWLEILKDIQLQWHSQNIWWGTVNLIFKFICRYPKSSKPNVGWPRCKLAVNLHRSWAFPVMTRSAMHLSLVVMNVLKPQNSIRKGKFLSDLVPKFFRLCSQPLKLRSENVPTSTAVISSSARLH